MLLPAGQFCSPLWPRWEKIMHRNLGKRVFSKKMLMFVYI